VERMRNALSSWLFEIRLRLGLTGRPLGKHGQLGQVLPLFALMAVVLLGGAALLTDVAWWWVNEQRMQRAADAGALAGAIHLPGNEALAFNRAQAETAKNGYINGVDGITVTPSRDLGDPRKLIVNIDGSVGTNFAKAFCWDGGPCLTKVDVGVSGAASFVLPVPMGSPESYYGVFGKLRTPGGGSTETGSVTVTGEFEPGSVGSGNWTATSGGRLAAVQSVDDVHIQTSGDQYTQQFGNFGLLGPGGLPNPSGGDDLVITGIEVLLDDVHLTQACSSTFVEVHLADNDGTGWTSPSPTSANDSPNLNTTKLDVIIGGNGSASNAAFESGWDRSDFSDSRFVVRLRSRKGCASAANIRVDQLRVRVYYRLDTFVADANIVDPYSGTLTPSGLWGTFINQGAEKINGDAYLPKWDPRKWGSNDEYDAEAYYNYGLEIPAGANGGELWIYDPVFCATSGSGRYGTGDRWFGNSTNRTSAYYTLWDTNNTPYIYADDVQVASSGTLFANIRASDESLNGPNLGSAGASTDCSVGATANQSDGRYWHNRWYRLANGLAGDATYRLHTRSTDPNNANAMDDANGHNSFALWSRASGGSPRIYGLGAMEAFTPLDPAGAATFYLAQIDAEHAGKTMVIKLWDPGDTGSLSAELRVLRPGSSDYVETNFSYSAERVANNASNCASSSGTNVGGVTTNTGGSSRFNGCWLTIEIPLPADYSAPRPATEDPSVEGGWWKIRYIMGGSPSDNPAFDLTTWEVTLRGNPVHLVPT